jgi:hypothetical protein
MGDCLSCFANGTSAWSGVTFPLPSRSIFCYNEVVRGLKGTGTEIEVSKVGEMGDSRRPTHHRKGDKGTHGLPVGRRE